jgi:hypothetical protein
LGRTGRPPVCARVVKEYIPHQTSVDRDGSRWWDHLVPFLLRIYFEGRPYQGLQPFVLLHISVPLKYSSIRIRLTSHLHEGHSRASSAKNATHLASLSRAASLVVLSAARQK